MGVGKARERRQLSQCVKFPLPGISYKKVVQEFEKVSYTFMHIQHCGLSSVLWILILNIWSIDCWLIRSH